MVSLLQRYRKRKALKELREFRKHLNAILHVNDDIFTASTKQKLSALLDEASGIEKVGWPAVADFVRNASLKAVKILPKKTHPIIREYVDIVAVAMTVAFGLRALYVQPFKIPTSSMQPTLFGIHYIEDTTRPDGSRTVPKVPVFLQYPLFSLQKAKATIGRSGRLDPGSITEYTRHIFSERLRFNIGGLNYDLPGSLSHVVSYCRIDEKFDLDSPNLTGEGGSVRSYIETMRPYREGETLCNGWQSLGDHLFVDRFTFQFREPRRGDIAVFHTEGLECRNTGYYFIKRIVGMPGDTIKIVDGIMHVKQKGSQQFVPITSLGIPSIDRIYSRKGGYHGHLAQRALATGLQVSVPENHYYMLGDNSARSSDSRYWGPVPRDNIVGKAFFVFWPFSRRWGFADSKDPVDVPTTKQDAFSGFLQPSMTLQ